MKELKEKFMKQFNLWTKLEFEGEESFTTCDENVWQFIEQNFISKNEFIAIDQHQFIVNDLEKQFSEAKKQINTIQANLIRRVDIILSEPDGIVREIMINNLLTNLF